MKKTLKNLGVFDSDLTFSICVERVHTCLQKTVITLHLDERVAGEMWMGTVNSKERVGGEGNCTELASCQQAK